MNWVREDLSFLKKQMDFCAEFMLKGYDLRESGLILTEIIRNVERKDIKGIKERKVIMRWC